MKKRIKQILKLLPFWVTYLVIHIPFIKFKKLNEIRPYYKNIGMRHFSKAYPNKENNKTRIIVYGLRSITHQNLAVFEKVFSDCFRYNGANVKNLICANLLSCCEAENGGVFQKNLCETCQKHRKYFFKNYPNDYIYFNEFISKDELTKIKSEVLNLTDKDLQSHKYLGVDTSRHALSTVCFTFHELFEEDNPAHLYKLRDSVLRGMILTRIAYNVFKKENPTHIFTLHGCYAAWGPFSEYFAKQGIPVYVHRKALYPGMGYFEFPKWAVDNLVVPVKDTWEKNKNIALTDGQKKKLDFFLLQRKLRKTADYQIYYGLKKGKTDHVLMKLLYSKKRKFIMYLHSLWDYGFEEAYSNCFKSNVEWIQETVEYFSKRNDMYLFIKPHPAENSVFEEKNEKTKKLISQLFGDLSDNITIIKSDCPLTSYDFMEAGCIGMTYFGTVGLEHAYFKKPALVASNIYYNDYGVVLKIKDKNMYFDLIENPQPLYEHPLKNYELIQRYAYHFYFRPNLRIPFYKEDVIFFDPCIDWSVLKNYEDFIKNNAVINHIAKSILEKKEVVNPE